MDQNDIVIVIHKMISLLPLLDVGKASDFDGMGTN